MYLRVHERRKAKCDNAVRRSSDDDRSSNKEHRVDALAPDADEGRGKLRKAAGSCKQTLIRRCPNGETHLP
jgi:hypothetical protein